MHLMLLSMLSLMPIQETNTQFKSRPISFFNVLPQQGYITQPEDSVQILVSSPEEWAELWTMFAPKQVSVQLDKGTSTSKPIDSKPPVVDFTKRRLIFVAMGHRDTGGYEVKIDNIIERGDHMMVHVVEIERIKNCMVSQAVTHPYSAVSIPQGSKPVRFKVRRIEEPCE